MFWPAVSTTGTLSISRVPPAVTAATISAGPGPAGPNVRGSTTAT